MVTRDEVLDVGLRLFAEHGYAGTSTKQLEGTLGLRPGGGGLFRHVTSKQELLEAAIERAMTRRHDPPAGPFDSPAQALVAAALALVDKDPALWRLVLREGRGLPLDVDALYDRLIQPAFEQAVTWMQAHGDHRPDVRARVVVAISALMYLRVSQLVYGRTPAGLDEASYTAVVEALLTADPPRKGRG